MPPWRPPGPQPWPAAPGVPWFASPCVELAVGVGVVVLASSARATCVTPSPMTAAAAPTAATPATFLFSGFPLIDSMRVLPSWSRAYAPGRGVLLRPENTPAVGAQP